MPEASDDTRPDGETPARDDKRSFDGDFDAERARSLIDKLRGEVKQSKAERDEARSKATEFEDRDKSEAEKLNGRLAAAEKRATDAEQRAMRLEVAAAKGLSARQAARLVGATTEELEADADELLADFTPADGDKGPATTRPVENLRGGGDPTEEPEETDPARLAAQVPRAGI